MDYILIYEGAVVVILLHNFVSLDQTLEYFVAMAHMWESGGHVTRICFSETKMVMFGHISYYNDSVSASEHVNRAHIIFIFLCFSHQTSLLIFNFFKVLL
jgi:hypothetical protein